MEESYNCGVTSVSLTTEDSCARAQIHPYGGAHQELFI